MTKKPELDAAYDLQSVEDVKELYSDWAETYDETFAETRGYALHDHVSDGFMGAGGFGPVLDVGAGTGLVGAALNSRGIGPLHGTDISAEMLAIAARKGIYKHTFVADILKPLNIPDDSYGGVVSAGTFTLGHVGPSPLAELIRITASDGVIALTVNAAHWERAGFASAFDDLSPKIVDALFKTIPIYSADADHDHAGDAAFLVTFRVR